PGSATEDIDGTVANRGEWLGVVRELDNFVCAEIVVPDLVAALHGQLLLLGCFQDMVEQQTHDLVALGGDADLLPSHHQRADHAGAGVRLTGAGRTLDRQDAALELESKTTGRLGPCFTWAFQCTTGLSPEARLRAQEKVAGGQEATRSVDIGRRNEAADPRERVGELLRRDSRVGKERGWMARHRRLCLLYVDGSSVEVDGDDFTY